MIRSQWSSDALNIDEDAFLSHLEATIPVSLISTFGKLVECEANDRLKDVLSRMDVEPFDHLPVRGGAQYVGLLSLYKARQDDAETADKGLVVRCVMQPLNADCLISAETGLLSFIVDADRAPCRLVVRGTRVDGIVSLSDLQKLPVRAALITLITHLELLMTSVIKKTFPDNERLFDYIKSDARRHAAEAAWERLKEEDLVLDVTGVLLFCDKRDLLTLIDKSPWSKSKIESNFKKMEKLRNSLAHAGDYAATRDNALATIEVVRLTQAWIGKLRDFERETEPSAKNM